MSTGSPILDLLNDLLKGCGVEDRKIELFGILRDIAREMAEGNVTEEEIMKDLRDLAGAIAVFRQRAGLSTNIDKVVELLLNALRQERAAMSLEAVRRRITARRRARREEGRRVGLF